MQRAEEVKQSITREQKEAVAILSTGTFLESFDLMLYVHMAVLLNEIFFPKLDAHMASLLAAGAFCSTYLMRPTGALIFGYIGDNIGRKATVVITTLMMAVSSMIMYILPTYAQIGIAASWIVTICRMVQGMSVMNEVVGAEIYITELIQPPKQYVFVGLVGTIMTHFGTVAALGIATMVLQYGANWRHAFLFGTVIALVGITARIALRETPEFLASKKKQLTLKALNIKKSIYNPPMNKKIAISYFLLQSVWPVWLYVIYIYYGMFLKQNLGYSAADVIQHNFYLTTGC